MAVVDAGNAVRDADLARLPQAGGSLGDQLAAEAAARPEGVPTLEGVIKASEGVAFGPARQLFARKHLAVYCATADSGDGMTVTLCEYPSAEQAERGAVESNQLMSQLSGHQFRVRRGAVLHVVARSTTPPESLAKVLGAFESL